MGLRYAINPSIHFSWLIFIFLVAVLGGVGSVIGTGAAGLLMGLIMGVAGAFLPYIWVNLVLFALLLIILLVKPEGLFQR
jgi:branched-chain amino acid transport system permease protein